MAKTQSEVLMRRYPPLRDIPDDEWEDFFPPGRKWTRDDDEYLKSWYGREPIISLTYAIGKPPWSLHDRAQNLGIRCGRNDGRRQIDKGFE